ncbi:hypothetical protein [Pacificoceanicola onchidii]|uniref:hypothetical protein n=1 Tax=Pacificoceanicola onchidii TaxID=2562685 RepID=UPI0010A558E4|nr:hypothetical protein [Pacificoceanicola onchidii]
MQIPNKPFDGAREDPMLLLGLLPKPLKAQGYFDLRGSDAANFTAASAKTLPAGTTLYRVYGGSAGQLGGYWSPEPPAPGSTEGDWRSESAVEPIWNDGTKMVKVTVKQGLTVPCWTGGIESQPAKIKDAAGTVKIVKHWFLVGGGTQFLLPTFQPNFSATHLDVEDLGPTPWAGQSVPSGVVDCAPAVALNDLNPENPAEAHARAVAGLATALHALSDGLHAQGEGAEAHRLRGAANTVTGEANGFLDAIRDGPEAVRLAAWGQSGLRRRLELDAFGNVAGPAQAMLDAVVMSAAGLKGG